MNNSPQDDLLELISDAKLVARYGQRAGRLQNDVLISAIADVEQLGNVSWSAKEIVALQIALNGAVQSINPTTLADLRSGWDPFRNPAKRNTPQIIFVCFSLIMIVVSAYYTQLYNRGNSIVVGLKQIQEARPAVRLGQVVRNLLSSEQQIRKSIKTGENSLIQEAYFRSVDDLHELDAKIRIFVFMAYDFRWELSHPLDTLLFFVDSRADTLTEHANFREEDWCGPEKTNSEALSPTEKKKLNESESGISPLQLLRDNSDLMSGFVCLEQIRFHPNAIPPIEQLIGQVTDYLRLVGLWILPSLYGALGALIFYMRSILNPLIPDPRIARIVHRVALGGFAGIIIAWFWAPGAKTTEFSNIGFNLFGMAFLLGFSIDVFFTFLDRAVQLVQGAVSKVGRA